MIRSLLLAQQAGQLQKEPLDLIFGDWGAYDGLRGTVLILIAIIVLTPFGGLSLLQRANMFCLPFLLNDMLKKLRR